MRRATALATRFCRNFMPLRYKCRRRSATIREMFQAQLHFRAKASVASYTGFRRARIRCGAGIADTRADILPVAILVLAAGAGKEGPGPLVGAVAGKGAAFPIPVTVVPQNLSDEEIDSLA